MLTHDKEIIHASCDPDWSTPQEMYDAMNAKWGPFDLDICADPSNHKHPLWIGPGGIGEDALTFPEWAQFEYTRVFMNPPWSRERRVSIVPFVVMARTVSRLYNIRFACVFPAAIQTRWWYRNVWHGAHEINYIPHRVNFDASDAMLNMINVKLMKKGKDPVEEAWNAAGNTAVVIYEGSKARGAKPEIDYWSYREGWEEGLIDG